MRAAAATSAGRTTISAPQPPPARHRRGAGRRRRPDRRAPRGATLLQRMRRPAVREQGGRRCTRARSEFGPRALGHRSILGDPRHGDVATGSTRASSSANGSGRSRRSCCSSSAERLLRHPPALAVHAVRRAGARRGGDADPGRHPRRLHRAAADRRRSTTTRCCARCCRRSRRAPAFRCCSTPRSTARTSRSSRPRQRRSSLVPAHAAARAGDAAVPRAQARRAGAARNDPRLSRARRACAGRAADRLHVATDSAALSRRLPPLVRRLRADAPDRTGWRGSTRAEARRRPTTGTGRRIASTSRLTGRRASMSRTWRSRASRCRSRSRWTARRRCSSCAAAAAAAALQAAAGDLPRLQLHRRRLLLRPSAALDRAARRGARLRCGGRAAASAARPGARADHYDTSSPRQTFAHWDARFIRWLAQQRLRRRVLHRPRPARRSRAAAAATGCCCQRRPRRILERGDARRGRRASSPAAATSPSSRANLCWWRIHLVDDGTAMVCHQGGPRGALDHWWPPSGAGAARRRADRRQLPPRRRLVGRPARAPSGFIVQQPVALGCSKAPGWQRGDALRRNTRAAAGRLRMRRRAARGRGRQRRVASRCRPGADEERHAGRLHACSRSGRSMRAGRNCRRAKATRPAPGCMRRPSASTSAAAPCSPPARPTGPRCWRTAATRWSTASRAT